MQCDNEICNELSVMSTCHEQHSKAQLHSNRRELSSRRSKQKSHVLMSPCPKHAAEWNVPRADLSCARYKNWQRHFDFARCRRSGLLLQCRLALEIERFLRHLKGCFLRSLRNLCRPRNTRKLIGWGHQEFEALVGCHRPLCSTGFYLGGELDCPQNGSFISLVTLRMKIMPPASSSTLVFQYRLPTGPTFCVEAISKAASPR